MAYKDFNNSAHLSAPIDDDAAMLAAMRTAFKRAKEQAAARRASANGIAAPAPNGNEHVETTAALEPAAALPFDLASNDPWWTRAPDVPPFVAQARDRYAFLRECGLTSGPTAYVTANYNLTGPLSKRCEAIWDAEHGKWALKPAETAASLYNGSGHKIPLDSLACLAQLRVEADECTCFTYGVYRLDDVRIKTGNEAARYIGCPLVVARDGDHLEYPKGPGVVPFDFDFYGPGAVPPEELHAILCKLVWWWSEADILWDYSCSSGIEHDSGQLLKPLRNCRALMMVDDASKGPALIKEAYIALWGARYGRYILTTNARALPRALVDTTMGQPERFDFSKPFLVGDLRQVDRRGFPRIIEGKAPRLITAGKGMDIELSEFHRNSPECQKALDDIRPAQEAMKAQLVGEAVAKARAEGRDETAARKRAERFCGGVDGEPVYLVDDDTLFMQDGSEVTVGDARRNPPKYDRARCAHPEDPSYRGDGRIGYINLTADIGPHIYSHAHGGQIYMLPRDHDELFPDIKPAPPLSVEALAALAKEHAAKKVEAIDLPPFQQPLPETLLPVAPFENDLLPDPLQSWARDTVDRMQCPADFIGAALMVALGSVIGAKVVIRPRQNDDKWSEAPNNYGGLIGQPSSKKSPAMAAAMTFVNKLETLAAARHKDVLRQYKAKKQLAEAHVRRSKASAVTRVSDAVEPDWDHEARTY